MIKVTDDPGEAARLVAEGRLVVLVGPDSGALGRFVASVAGPAPAARPAGATGTCLVAVLVGDLSDPAIAAAASEMAAELWPWAGAGAEPGAILPTGRARPH